MRQRPILIEEAVRLAGEGRPDYLESLYRYSRMLNHPALIVEIGTHRGDSAIAMACAIRGSGSHIICIDPVFQTGEISVPDSNQPQGIHYKSALIELLNRISDCGLDGYISVVPHYSWFALDRWDEREISLLVVDGEHTYEAVRKDCEWMQFVKPGGWAAFDDWMEAVSSAVRDYIADKPYWKILHQSTDAPDGDMVVTLLQKIC